MLTKEQKQKIKEQTEEKIKELQAKKEMLYPEVKKAHQKNCRDFNAYTASNNHWLKLKTEWEKLDREEKLLAFSSTKKKTIINKTTKNTTRKTIQEKAKDKVLKSLENLPSELRNQILANFKVRKKT